jgi:homopolymeric O-antigen transport system ATP-binding protein
MTNAPMVRLTGAGKSYRSYSSFWWRMAGWINGVPTHFADKWVLRDISFTVQRGESVGIVGRNGAGKSTLLKLIAGTLPPTEGEVTTHGRINAVLELGMGFNPEFTARQNVVHSCGLMGYRPVEIADVLPEIERFADVGEYFDQPMRTFSSGMQVRVAFAVATAFRPDILIVDEALAVGDLSFQAKCFERIAALRNSGTTLLFVSHGAGDIVKHCQRALFIKDGRLALDGPARDVTNVYLDYLFGKEARRHRSEAAIERSPVDPFDAATEDHFHARTFYRKEEHRWGVGGAQIIDYHIAAGDVSFPTALCTHQTLRVSFKVKFDRAVERPVYGILLKTIEGVFVYGTNSMLARSSTGYTGPAEAASVHVAAFSFPLMLNAGGYLLSLGISEELGTGELVPLDRRYDSVLFSVSHETPVIGLVDLDAGFELSQLPVAG